jgi:uncharacterized membrane protein
MSKLRTAGRITLGAILVLAGTSHLTFARDDFRAQVPEFVPLKEDTTVLLSGAPQGCLRAGHRSQTHRPAVRSAAAGGLGAVVHGGAGAEAPV